MTPIELPAMITRGRDKDPSLCQWFLLCQEPATTTVNHSVLGIVDTCKPCAQKVWNLGGGR